MGSPHRFGATELTRVRFESSPLSEYDGVYIVMTNLPNIGELILHTGGRAMIELRLESSPNSYYMTRFILPSCQIYQILVGSPHAEL